MTSEQPTQAARMRAAVNSAVAVGQGFLGGGVDADKMANTMMAAYTGYLAQEKAAGRTVEPTGEQETHLWHALEELNACGSGFLAERCDAA